MLNIILLLLYKCESFGYRRVILYSDRPTFNSRARGLLMRWLKQSDETRLASCHDHGVLVVCLVHRCRTASLLVHMWPIKAFHLYCPNAERHAQNGHPPRAVEGRLSAPFNCSAQARLSGRISPTLLGPAICTRIASRRILVHNFPGYLSGGVGPRRQRQRVKGVRTVP